MPEIDPDLARETRTTSAQNLPLPPKMPPFMVGAPVQARFKASKIGPVGTKWVSARITCVHDDGRYDVEYTDGDIENSVAPRFVRDVIATTAVPRRETRESITPMKAPRKRGRCATPGCELPDFHFGAHGSDLTGADATSNVLRTRRKEPISDSTHAISASATPVVLELASPTAPVELDLPELASQITLPCETDPVAPTGDVRSCGGVEPAAVPAASPTVALGGTRTLSAVKPALCEYELERLRNIEENRKALEALGLANQPLIHPRQVAFHRQGGHAPSRRDRALALPVRIQPARARAAPDRLAPVQEFDDLDTVERLARAHGKRRRWRDGAAKDDGGEQAFPRTEVIVHESSWSLPVLPTGRVHNSSCHLCTQASHSCRCPARSRSSSRPRHCFARSGTRSHSNASGPVLSSHMPPPSLVSVSLRGVARSPARLAVPSARSSGAPAASPTCTKSATRICAPEPTCWCITSSRERTARPPLSAQCATARAPASAMVAVTRWRSTKPQDGWR